MVSAQKDSHPRTSYRMVREAKGEIMDRFLNGGGRVVEYPQLMGEGVFYSLQNDQKVKYLRWLA